MKHQFAFALVLACSISVRIGFADTSLDMQKIVADIESGEAELAHNTVPAVPNLVHDISALTDLINAQQLSGEALSVAYFYRARARHLINLVRAKGNQPPDLALAKAALADLDIIVADGAEFASRGITIANAEFFAGSVAMYGLRSEPLAYSYWDKCAKLGHGGCMNNMAWAKLTGRGGQQIDILQALELNAKVYETGTRYGCAGAFSAKYNSMINYFTGIRRPGDEELEWLQRAYPLLDRIEVLKRRKNPCRRADFEIVEYLIRLSRGEQRRDLLDKAMKEAEVDATEATIQYLLGALDDNSFRMIARVTSSKGERCDMDFYALWNAELKNDADLARWHFEDLKDLGSVCVDKLVFAKKYGF